MLWDTSGSLPLLVQDTAYDYLYGASARPYAQIDRTTGEITYLHADNNGSTVAATNATGERTGTWKYTPYGTITTHTGTATTSFLYVGEYQDTTGLYYLRARYYDPTTGSFLTRDPLEDITNTPYAYLDGNPLQNTDPTGLCNWLLWQCGGAMSDLGQSTTNAVVNFGRGASFGLTDKVADWISPGASCMVSSEGFVNKFSQGLGMAGTLVASGGNSGTLAARGAGEGALSTRAAPMAERLFTSRLVGVDSKLLGHSYARGSSGLLNRTGSRLKFGWTSSGEFGGGWHLRLGLGRNPIRRNQALHHIDFRSTHVPNSIANDLLDVIRGLRGIG